MGFSFLRRLGLSVIPLFLLSLISYHILWRDPLNRLGELNLFSGYMYYIKNLFQGHFEISTEMGDDLTVQILSVFPSTLMLTLVALGLSLIMGLPLGFVAAYLRKKTVGKILTLLGSLSLAFPVFWLALLLLYYFPLQQWEIGATNRLQAVNVFQPLVLPTLTLIIPSTLEIMRFTQRRVEYVMAQHYINVAQTQGKSALAIFRYHLLGNTLPALIPSITRHFTLIFAFAMLIENIFNWEGIGHWLINALAEKNYRAISAGVVVIGSFVLLIDFVTDLLKISLDPSQKKDWYAK